MDATLFTKAGFLRINVTSSLGQIPVKDATVSITYTGEPGRVLEELTTDESGLTDTIETSSLPTYPTALTPKAKCSHIRAIYHYRNRLPAMRPSLSAALKS